MTTFVPKSVRLTAAATALLAAIVAVPVAAQVSGASGAPAAHVLAGPIKLS